MVKNKLTKRSGTVIAVLSLQVFVRDLNCEFAVLVILPAFRFKNQHLVSMFPTWFVVDANGLTDTDERCSTYLSPFEAAAYFNFVGSVAFV